MSKSYFNRKIALESVGQPSYPPTMCRKLYFLSLVGLGIFLISCVPTSATISLLTKNLSNNYGHSLNQKLAQSNGYTYFVWTDTSNSSTDKGQIFFRSSNNDGKSFSKTVILSNKTLDANLPDLSTNGNDVYVSWEGDYLEDSYIFFRASADNGNTFGKTLNISNGIIGSTLPNIAIYENSVYVVWVGSNRTDPNNFEVFIRTSQDRGKTFGPVIDLSKSAGDSTDPHIFVPTEGGHIYVAYTDCDAIHDDPLCAIYLTKSSDSGRTFRSPQLISIVPLVNQNLTFLGNSHSSIISSLLDDYGIKIHKQTGEHNSVIPIITSSRDGRDVYILWQDDLTQTGATDIFFRKSNDYGNTFGDSINLSNTLGISRLPQVVTVGSDVYVVWSDTNTSFSQFDIFFKKIGNHGTKIGKTINLSNSKENSAPSDLGILNDSKTIYIAWTENVGTNKNNILVVKSSDAGSTFEKPVKLDSTNSLNPGFTHISYKNNTGLVWTEHVKKNEDVYFAELD